MSACKQRQVRRVPLSFRFFRRGLAAAAVVVVRGGTEWGGADRSVSGHLRLSYRRRC